MCKDNIFDETAILIMTNVINTASQIQTLHIKPNEFRNLLLYNRLSFSNHGTNPLSRYF